jgi:hypothetical protein
VSAYETKGTNSRSEVSRLRWQGRRPERIERENSESAGMKLVGSRSTLIPNLCALGLASVGAVAGTYLVHKCLGYYRPTDIVADFTPVVVMFIIRNRIFSYFFLFLYAAPTSQILYRTQHLHVDFHAACGGRFEDPAGLLAPTIFVLSIACLVIYVAYVLLDLTVSRIRYRDD